MAFRLSARARLDLDEVLHFSLDHYGRGAASRYALLLATAIEAVASEPLRHGSLAVRRRPGVRTYPIAHSRTQVAPEHRVGRAAHQVVYPIGDDRVVDILAIVGNSYPPARVIA